MNNSLTKTNVRTFLQNFLRSWIRVDKGQCFSPTFKLSTFQTSPQTWPHISRQSILGNYARHTKKHEQNFLHGSHLSVDSPVAECVMQMMWVILTDFGNVGRWTLMTPGDYIWQCTAANPTSQHIHQSVANLWIQLQNDNCQLSKAPPQTTWLMINDQWTRHPTLYVCLSVCHHL